MINQEPWRDSTKNGLDSAAVKHQVAELVAANPGSAVLSQHQAALDGFVRGLEQRLDEIRNRRR